MKALKLNDGHSLSADGKTIIRKANIARDGSPKRIPTPELAPGMHNRTSEHSGMPGFSNPIVDDEKMATKPFLNGKSAPIHPGMFSKSTRNQRGTDKGPDHGSAVLRNAVLK